MKTIKKVFLILAGIFIAIIPILIFVGTWCLLYPVTFWQKFFLFIFGSIILGPLQVWCIVLGVGVGALLGESDHKQSTYNFDNRVAKY